MQNEINIDFTKNLNNFSDNYFDNLKDTNGFILKSRSPSCGINDTKIFAKIGIKSIIDKENGTGIIGEDIVNYALPFGPCGEFVKQYVYSQESREYIRLQKCGTK